jgi:hypothetical protein
VDSYGASVITFDAIEPELVSDLDRLAVHSTQRIPAVRATADPRWLTSTAQDDPFAIGLGAAGCLLAHVDAWSSIARSESEFSLILESDARLTSYGLKYMNWIVPWMDETQANLVVLGTNRDLPSGRGALGTLGKVVHQAERIIEESALNLRPPVFQQALRVGIWAYIVRRDFAAWLSQWNPDFKIPVDQWLHTLSRDPRHQMFRTRQALWTTGGRHSHIEEIGR